MSSSDIPFLSVCLITKNEEKQIERCLTSVLEIADEIVVLDTGSTDNTVSIAEKLGAKVFHTVWENNFAKARNQCLEHARGKWIFFLDADERLAPECSKGLKAFLEDKDTKPLHYSVKFINFLDGANELQGVIHFYGRIFPGLPKFRYKGKLHEQLWNLEEGKPELAVALQDIIVYHYGYDPNVFESKDKAKRNEEILLNAIDEEPNFWFHRHNYGVQLVGLKRYYEALEQLQLAESLAEKEGRKDFDTSNYFYQAQIYFYMEKYENTIEYCKKALERKDTFYDIYFLLGNAYRRLGKIELALENYNKACFSDAQKDFPTSRVFIKLASEWGALYEIASIYADEKKDYEKALDYYLKIERYKRENPIILLKTFNTYLRLEKLDMAEKTAIEFKKLFPSEKQYKPDFEVVSYYWDNKRYREVIEFLKKYMEEFPEQCEELVKITLNSFLEVKEYESSLTILKLFLKIVKNESEKNDIITSIKDCLIKLDRLDEAVGFIQENIHTVSNRSNLYNDIAVIYLMKNDTVKAREYLNKSIEAGPQDFTRFNLAKLDFSENKYDTALLLFENLIKKEYFHCEALMMKAIIHYERNEYEKSVSDLNEIIKKQPDKIEVYEYLAKNYKKLNRYDLAYEFEKGLNAIRELTGYADS